MSRLLLPQFRATVQASCPAAMNHTLLSLRQYCHSKYCIYITHISPFTNLATTELVSLVRCRVSLLIFSTSPG
jgi:hypothetical protein